MAFFSRFKSAGAPAPSNDSAGRLSTRESVKKPILLRAHTSGINDLACDIKCMPCMDTLPLIQQKTLALVQCTHSESQAKTRLDRIQRRRYCCLGRGDCQFSCALDLNSIVLIFVQPVKIKTERSATPRIIEAGLGEVLCVFYNPATKQFWTSHKAHNTIIMWSSSGSKDREIKCAFPPAYTIPLMDTAPTTPSPLPTISAGSNRHIL